MLFRNRHIAGKELAGRLKKYFGRKNTLVLGLTKGGVPVAYEVAKRLKLAMDVVLVKKIGVPGQEELAVGAVTSGNIRFYNRYLIDSLHLPLKTVNDIAETEEKELEREEKIFRSRHPALEVKGRTIILVDDGLATGASMFAAIEALYRRGVQRVVAAVPVASDEACNRMKAKVDSAVCLRAAHDFTSVGQWYFDFKGVGENEVSDLLAQNRSEMGVVKMEYEN